MQATLTTQQGITGNQEAMLHAMRTHLLRSVPRSPAWRRLAGFTLIELMIVVAIVAILGAIAIPAYQKQIMQSRRTSAKTALFDLSGREEKYYAANNYYPASLTSVGYSTLDGNGDLQVPNNTNEDYYSVSFVPVAATATTPASYTAKATPVGTQSNDGCGTYTLTDLGVQANSTNNSGTGSGCW